MSKFAKFTSCSDGLWLLIRPEFIIALHAGPRGTTICTKEMSYAVQEDIIEATDIISSAMEGEAN